MERKILTQRQKKAPVRIHKLQQTQKGQLRLETVTVQQRQKLKLIQKAMKLTQILLQKRLQRRLLKILPQQIRELMKHHNLLRLVVSTM